MEIAADKKYYHIQKKGSWEVGETYFIGKEKNTFYTYFDKKGNNYYDPKSGRSINTFDIAKSMVDFLKTKRKSPNLTKFHSFDKDQAIKHLFDTLGHYLRFVREHLFEEVRKEFFPDLPSRLRCLWIIPHDKNAVNYWWKNLGRKGKIFEISVSGKVHQASQQYLNITTQSFDYIREQAFKYWAAKSVENQNEYECLFEGFVKVEKEKQITDFK